MADPPHHQLFVFRHGATEWSENGRHTGTTDLPLLPEGVEQAKENAAHIAGHRFAVVLCSPLQRARTTCALAGLADQAELAPDLIEWDYGDLEGLTTATIRQTYPGWTIWDGPVPGGETIDEVAAHADRVIERVRQADGDSAVFGHGHMLRVLVARWCELDPIEGRRFPLDPATLNVLGWEHEYSAVHVWNQRG